MVPINVPSSLKSPLSLISPFTTVPELRRLREGTSSSLFLTIIVDLLLKNNEFKDHPKINEKT
jgi:hypothetical protein